MNPEQVVRVIGDKGGVALEGLDNPFIYTEEAGQIVDIKPQYANVDPGVEEIKQFAAVVKGEMKPTATVEQGRTVQAILDAIYRSGEERKEVSVA
jgi:predicted dehydrogenase